MFNARYLISAIHRDGEFRLILESDRDYTPLSCFMVDGNITNVAPEWLCLVASHIASEQPAILEAYLPGDATIVPFPEGEELGTEVLLHENIVEDLYGHYYVKLRQPNTYAAFSDDVNRILQAIGDATAGTFMMDKEVLHIEALVSERILPIPMPSEDLAAAISYRYDTSPVDLVSEPDGDFVLDDDGKIRVIPDEQTEAAEIAKAQEEWVRECDDNGIPTDADGMDALADKAAEEVDEGRA